MSEGQDLFQKEMSKMVSKMFKKKRFKLED